MKFGPVPIGDALGAILAHSLRHGTVRLRKGKVLEAVDIGLLTEADVSEIVVAQLEDGEIGENHAAAQLINGFDVSPDSQTLRITDAFTGRTNLLAKIAGVVRVDAEKINAFNQINPMITIATVPDFHMADQGTMLATIKVISFGVEQDDVTKAAGLLRDAVTLEPPKLSTAALIVTSSDKMNPEKGIEAVRQRLERWGVALESVAVVAHDEQSISEVLPELDQDLVLILTETATSDIRDVAPSAVVSAGGRIERFGMPVDPGNLLFVGTLDRRAIIGLPGCARSPALNGTDWVLSRIACGINVRNEDIAGMGVGGLLKEIPSRPQPRNRRRQ
ncbi:MAG: molybdopterin-binding protein [Paracoccaceae bacterium]|nr:molybdopterin-binding protein [Paracoccaceae bacterium]MDG2260100.1 molybdopterin-binding protein [Paracoccaceae bacterium]